MSAVPDAQLGARTLWSWIPGPGPDALWAGPLGEPHCLCFPCREGTAMRTRGWKAFLGLCCGRDSGDVCASGAFAGGDPESSAHSRQPDSSLRCLWPMLCVTLVTLPSCCLGFPTCWAEMGLLAESARVLMRQGLAGAWALGKVVCHGFLRGAGRGRRPCQGAPRSPSY